MHNFVYLAQRRSQEFSCEPNFGGGYPPWLRHCTGSGTLRQVTTRHLRLGESIKWL